MFIYSLASSGRRALEFHMIYRLFFAAFSIFFLTASVYGSGKKPLIIHANKAKFSRKSGWLDAWGDAVVKSEKVWLKTSEFSFKRDQQTLKVPQNFILSDPSTGVMKGGKALISSDFTEGVAEDVTLYLDEDGSTFSAKKMTRIQKDYGELDRSTYSPCKICKGRSPFWQLKARKTYWDGKKQELEHRDAVMEIGGVPIFFLPHIQHPDPTVKRRSGFLTPQFHKGKDIGEMIMVPYYYAVSDHQDTTFYPYLGTRAQILKNQYRQKLQKGEIEVQSSFAHNDVVRFNANEKSRNFRWHIDGNGKYHHNRHWRSTFQINRASDPIYGKRFTQIGYEPTLAVTSYQLERFGRNSHFDVQTLKFQETSSLEDNNKFPFVIPHMTFRYWDNPFPDRGILVESTTHFLGITRRQGRSVARLGEELAISKKWILPPGFYLGVGGNAKMDAYWSKKDIVTGGVDQTPNERTGQQTRFFPQAHVDMGLPFRRLIQGGQVTFTPQAKLVMSPQRSGEEKLPNEDSTSIDLDEGNLFSNHRLVGRDRIDPGSRFVLGAEVEAERKSHKIAIFLGQSYQLSKVRTRIIDTGFDHSASDYVGRLSFKIPQMLDATARARFRKENFSLSRLSTNITIGPDFANLKGGYTLYRKDPGNLASREINQVSLTAQLKPIEKWTFEAGMRYDYLLARRILSQQLKAIYENECFRGSFILTRSNFRDKEMQPKTDGLIELSFRNLGGFQATKQFAEPRRRGEVSTI